MRSTPSPRATSRRAPGHVLSGLKTAAINLIHNAEQKGEALDLPPWRPPSPLRCSDTPVPRTMEAARQAGLRRKVAVAGGVAANSRIRADLERACAGEGRQALPAAAVPVRGQRRHDRLPGLLRVCIGRGGPGPDLNAYANRDIGRG